MMYMLLPGYVYCWKPNHSLVSYLCYKHHYRDYLILTCYLTVPPHYHHKFNSEVQKYTVGSVVSKQLLQ